MNRIFYRLSKLLIIATLFVLVSCAPTTKEEYIADFKTFVNDIKEERASYSDADWKRAEQKYEQFSNVWYEKFKDELSSKDRNAIRNCRFKFKYYNKIYKTGRVIDDVVNALDGKDDVADELDDVIKEVEELGSEAGELINAVSDDVDDVINDIYDATEEILN